MEKEKGFTLIELMVVVAIIGTLSLIAIPAYQNYAKKSSEVSCLAETKAYSDKLFIDINTGVEVFNEQDPSQLLESFNPTASACDDLTYSAAVSATAEAEAALANIAGTIKNPVGKSNGQIVCTLGDVVTCLYPFN